jgi:lipopolysaccharide/colanic/teichoic acid biosynthesis glycosyltransferase
MSLIGPRPLLPEYLPIYSELKIDAMSCDLVLGWAQVNGRNAISWSQKFEYDVWYVDNEFCTFDIK